MIFTLTDRHYNVLDAYETDDYLIGQYIGSILETLEINVLVKSLNAEHWVEGNYIMCQDKKGKKRWFTIYDCDDSHGGDVKSLFCYSGTIDIVAEDAAPISAPVPKPFKWYFDQIFYDTGIVLGINEISDLTRKLEFTSENASNAEMLQYVLNGFDNAEASLDVEFDGATPTKLVLNVYKRIGNEEPQTILSDEDDSLTSLNRKGSISDLATCINPTGAEDENGNPITLLGKHYEERDEQGNILYYSPVDSPRVFSVVARQNFYVQLPGKANGEFDGYINRRYESQATTQDTLWQESLAQLKKIDRVSVSYEANGYIDCSIGDNVQIVSHEMKPPVMIAARTIEYKFNDDDPSRNVYKFGNYVELASNLDELSKIVSDLKQKLLIVTVVASAGTVFKNGTGETDLTAVTILGGKEVDTDGLFYNYVWSKYDKNGNFVGATSGKKITVYARNIDEKETYIVTVENEGAKSIGQITVTNVNDGAQGPPGADGKSLYTWVKYANDINGNGMSDYPDGKKYIGLAYNKTTPTESTNPADYTWALIQGPQGVKGTDGQTYYTWIKYADSPTSGMSDDPTGKKYMGIAYNKTTPTESTNYADYSWSLIQGPQGPKGEQGPQGPQGVQGPKGADGQTLYTWIKYADSPTSGMSDTPDGKKYIGLAYNKTTPTESSNYADYSWSLIQGPQGVQGPKGADGVTTYTWVKYADDDKGTGMSDSPNGKRYLGLAYNKTTPTESTNPNDYSWSPLYDNVKVDGRNFVRNADLVDNSNYWSFNGLNSYEYVENAYMNVRGLKTVRTGTSNVWAGMISTRGVKVEPGEQVTLSVWYKVEVEADRLVIEVEYYGTADRTGTRLGTASVSLDRTVGDWRYGFGTFTVPNYSGDIYAYFRVYVVQSGTVTYCMPKLERGNIPTGFSIAQEDITERTERAKRDAQNAQSTADGKNTVFYQATAPSTAGRKINDLWYDTDDGYKPYRFNGSNWVAAPFGNAAIANLDVGKIVGDQGNFNWLEAKHIKSLNGLNIGNGQFVVDANGNVKFAGNLEGASGTFGEVTVKDGDFYLKDTKSGIRYSLVKKTNILGDHSFELIKISEPTSQDNIDHWWLPIITDNTNWETIGTPRGVPISIAGPGPADAMPIFGNRALLVNSTNYIEQPVWDVTANTQYTFSVHAKRPYNNTPGAVRLEVYYYKLNTDGTSSRTLVAAQSFDTVASDYSVSRHALTFTSPNVARTGSDEIIFVIKGVNANWVHVDGVQVVKSAYPTVYDTEDSLWSFMNSRNGFKARAIWTEGIYNGVNGIDIDDNRIRIYSNESLNYFSVENIESRFSTVPYDQWKDPEPNVKKSIKVNGGIATDGLYANAGSGSKNAIATNGKIFVGGEGIELSWVGGTPYIDFSRRAGVDCDMRIMLDSSSNLCFLSSDYRVRHRFGPDGTKTGGTIEIDGNNIGMSPIDSPQVLIETIEFDIPLTADGTKVLLDSRFAKAVNYRFAVFQNNGRVIEKGPDYFIIAGDGLADIRIVGERVGYAGVYFDDMTMEGAN